MKRAAITLFAILLTCATPPKPPVSRVDSHSQTRYAEKRPVCRENILQPQRSYYVDPVSAVVGGVAVAFGFKFGLFGFIRFIALKLFGLVRKNRVEPIRINIEVRK